ELGAGAARTGVAPVEEAGTAVGALVGDQVRVVAEDEVVDERDLGGHRPLPRQRRFSAGHGSRTRGIPPTWWRPAERRFLRPTARPLPCRRGRSPRAVLARPRRARLRDGTHRG